MSYLTSSTTTKKKYCNHIFQTKYLQGSNKPFSICAKCGIKDPASKQSNSEKIFDKMIEWQCETNWNNPNQDGWKLPGTQQAHDWCGEWKTIGCMNIDGHKGTIHEGKIFIKRYQRFCYRGDCERCHKKWMARESSKATRRILEFQRIHRQLVRHIIISPSKEDRKLSIKKLRKKTYSVLKNCGVIGGVVVFHPFKPKQKDWYYEPHFHALVFGFRTYRPDLRVKDRWYVKDVGIRKTVFGTFLYLLSHAGVKPRNHTTTWFGGLSYSIWNPDFEYQKDCCPCCGMELEPLKYMYVTGKPPPPDEIIEMFVDPRGWEPVKTMENYEYEYDYRYEYASTRDLNEILKSLVEAN